jgi:hypothetical protein
MLENSNLFFLDDFITKDSFISSGKSFGSKAISRKVSPKLSEIDDDISKKK